MPKELKIIYSTIVYKNEYGFDLKKTYGRAMALGMGKLYLEDINVTCNLKQLDKADNIIQKCLYKRRIFKWK